MVVMDHFRICTVSYLITVSDQLIRKIHVLTHSEILMVIAAKFFENIPSDRSCRIGKEEGIKTQ